MKILSPRFLLSTLVTVAILSSCGKTNSDYYGSGGFLPTHFISILDSSFSPNTLTISRGSSITFVNSSSISHTIISDDTTTIKTTILVPGTSFYILKDTIGTFGYHCKEHPNVTGTIIFRP